VKKCLMSEEMLIERNKIVAFFDRLGWEASEVNLLFDQEEEVDFEAEYSREDGDQLITTQYDAEQRGLILSIDAPSKSVTFLFDVKQKIDDLLLVFEEGGNEVSIENYWTFIKEILERDIRIFRLENNLFIEQYSQEEENNIALSIESTLKENRWNSFDEIPVLPSKIKSDYPDVQFCYCNKDFKIIVCIYVNTMLIRHLLYSNVDQLFSDLYIFSSRSIKIIDVIDRWKDILNRENYATFVAEIIGMAERVIFDNNGVIIELK